jgi:hypothetical protein
MPVTVTTTSKSAEVSVTNVSKSTSGIAISTGNPIGILLAFTYSADQSADDLTVTLVSKS